MEIKYLQVLIMENGEIMFLGRSLGFLKKEEKKFLFEEEEIKN